MRKALEAKQIVLQTNAANTMDKKCLKENRSLKGTYLKATEIFGIAYEERGSVEFNLHRTY